MTFDLATAKPAEEKGGFDLSSAKPIGEQLGAKDVPDMPAKAAAAPGEEPLAVKAVRAPIEAGRRLLGNADAALSIGSSIPAQLAGRALAVGHAFLGGKYGTQEGAAEAQDFGSRVADAMTYDPKTDAGRERLDSFGKMVEASKVEGMGPMMPQGAPAGGPAVIAGRQVAPKVIAAGRAGLAVTPDEAGAGIVGRTAAGLSGEAKLAKNISNRNQAPLIEKIANDLELPKDMPLDREALEGVRAKQGQAYEVVRKTGRVTMDDQVRIDLDAAAQDVRTAANELDHRKESSLLKVVDSLSSKETLDANTIVSEIKNLRKDAKKAFRGSDDELGIGSLDVARALEDVLDRHIEALSTSNEYGSLQISPEAMDALKKARVKIAQSYAADKALRGTEINPQVYAKMLEDRVPLTGGAKEVGEFARDFPRSSMKPSHMPVKGPDWSDVIMALASGGKSALKTAGLSLLRPAGRAILASDLYQALQRSQPSAQVPIPSPDAATILSATPALRQQQRQK